MSVKIKKSRNFEKNLDFNRQSKQMKKNQVLVGQALAANSLKLVPVSTRQTYNSVESKASGKTVTIKSINWKMRNGGTRYNYTKSSIKKNSNKYKWFSRTYNKNKKQYNAIMRGDVLV